MSVLGFYLRAVLGSLTYPFELFLDKNIPDVGQLFDSLVLE